MAVSVATMIIMFVIVSAILIVFYFVVIQGAGPTISAVLFEFFGGLFA